MKRQVLVLLPIIIQVFRRTIQEVLAIIGDIASVISLAWEIVAFIRDRMLIRRERIERNPKEDKKVYDKYEVAAEIEERQNPMIYVVHIHVCKRKIINC